jgi:hypothetical protein
MFSEMVWWSFVWMLPLAGSFAAIGFLALMALLKPDSKYGSKFNLMFLLSAGAACVTILAALIFILSVLDVTNWWLDAAFWAGLIGGVLNAVFSYLIIKSRGDKIAFKLRV